MDLPSEVDSLRKVYWIFHCLKKKEDLKCELSEYRYFITMVKTWGKMNCQLYSDYIDNPYQGLKLGGKLIDIP